MHIVHIALTDYSIACLQSEVSVVKGVAQFVDNGVVEVNGEQYSANHILIATGGAPVAPNLPGTAFSLKLINC